MKRLIITALILLVAAVGMAAQQYYTFPTINSLRDDARVLVYSNLSSKNITGLALKQEISAFAHLSAARRIGSANQIFNLMTTATATKLIKRAASGAGAYTRVLEVKDGTGKIVHWVDASGSLYFGTPISLSISSVYPANGATNVSNGVWVDYSSSGGGRIRTNPTIPAVTYNKSATVSISTQYIQGSSIAPTDYNNIWAFNTFSGAAATTYTMKVVRGSIVQTDGESASSCGTAMTDVSGICTSTFTMK